MLWSKMTRHLLVLSASAMFAGCGLEPIDATGEDMCPDGGCSDMGMEAGNSTTPFFNNTVNSTTAPNTAPNTGTPINNQAANQSTPPNSGVANDGCMVGALECVDDQRFRRCVDNGQGGTLWSNPSFCDYASCSMSTQRCCDVPCEQAGAKRCISGQVQECVENDGCLEWAEPEACLEGQICGGDGVCMDECTSSCQQGDKRCLMEGGPEIQSCVEVAPGCFQYSANTTQCGAGNTCENGACVQDTSCSDDCSNEGATSCSGTTERTCQRGADGCLDLVNTGTCGAMPMGECFSNSLGGVNVPHGTCVQNATSNTFHTCPDGSTGCLWAFCNDGNWEYQCNRGNLGSCAGNTSNAHNTCN